MTAPRPSEPTAPFRVALFTGAYNHIADGVSLTLNRLVAYLEALGHTVLVFAPTVDDPPLHHAGTLVPVPSIMAPGRPDYRLSLGLSRKARQQLETFRPTLVHIATPDLLGLGARAWALDRGVPLVSSYHTHFSSYLTYYHLGFLEGGVWRYLRWFYRPCKHLYVPTPSMAEVLPQHGIRDGLRLWPRGVETDRFNPTHRSAAWRQAMGFSEDEVVLAYVSRLVWEKGPDLFADVVQQLEATQTPHRSLIVGDGPARGPLEERLPHTVFTGYLSGDDLARAYASADVFLFPSDTETFGNVTLEAMASGLPTICADATGSKTLVDHGTTGFLVPTRDTQAFYDAAHRLVTDAPLRHRMGEAARAQAMQYDWPVILERLVGYYGEALSPSLSPS